MKLGIMKTPSPTPSIPDTRPLRVAAYARVSTMNQVRRVDSSVDTQINHIRLRSDLEAQQSINGTGRGWKIVGEYREEGKSGKNTDRPELQRLLADVRDGKVDVVVVTKIDRITRSLIDFYNLWALFEEHKVDFIALNDNFETVTAAGRAMLKITLVFAELERERTSERTKEKIQARRAAGLWFGGSIPFGYRPHPTNKTTIMIDEECADLVRELFRRYLEGTSARALTRYLNQAGVVRPVRVNKHGDAVGGRPFTVQAILNMLSCRVYVAERAGDGGESIACNWTPIIERPLFDRVQARLAANSTKRPTGRPCGEKIYLLEGLLLCGACGAAMTRSHGTSWSGTKHYYYRCANKHRTAQTRCQARDVPVDAVEGFVLARLKAYALDRSAIDRAVAATNAGRDRELADIEAALSRKRGAYAAASKAVNGLVDAVEQDAVESGSGNGPALRARLREREVAAQALKLEVEDLAVRHAEAGRQVLEASTVEASYRDLPRMVDAAVARRDWLALRYLVPIFIDIVTWYEDVAKGERGRAVIRLYPVPEAVGGAYMAPEADQPGEPALNGGSPGCPVWLPSVDLNHGPDD